MDNTSPSKKLSEERRQLAIRGARERARTAKWDLNTAVFLFAVLIIILILLFQEIDILIVSPIAVFGLAMVWVVGWRRGKQLYKLFYEEDLLKLQDNEEREREKELHSSIEEAVDERVQKIFRKRLSQEEEE